MGCIFVGFSIIYLFCRFLEKVFFIFGTSEQNDVLGVCFFNIVIGSFIALVVGRQGAIVYFFLSFFPAWAAAVRRLHDAGQSGLWSVVPIILFAGAAYFIQTDSAALVTLCFSLAFIFSALLVFFLCLKGETLYEEDDAD